MPAPSLKAAPPPIPKKPTKASIGKFLELEERRKDLERQARQLGKEAAAIGGELLAYVAAHTKGKVRELKTCGYRLSILTKQGSVGWKKEFVLLAGPEQAAELEAAQPTKDVLDIAVA